jgi:hypothetical protein
MSDFNFYARYKVRDEGDVAWVAVKHPQFTEECQGHPDDGEMNGPIGETFYCDGSCEEPQEDTTKVVCHMVGDDRMTIFDIEDLVEINEHDYCPECGQIGCKALKG